MNFGILQFLTQVSCPQWGTVPHMVLPDAAFLKIAGAKLELLRAAQNPIRTIFCQFGRGETPDSSIYPRPLYQKQA